MIPSNPPKGEVTAVPLWLQPFVEDQSPMLMKWALGKTGRQQEAEELAQEVWLQFFDTVSRQEAAGTPVAQPEHLLWRVARFVWGHQLRSLIRDRRTLLPLPEELIDPADFSTHLADSAEQQRLILLMRQCVMRQSHLQREILLLYYLDQRPIRDIAALLGVTPATVKWHLFDTRKKMKGELHQMSENENSLDFVYRPKHLHMGISGWADQPDIDGINDSLVRQNLCLACYQAGRTLPELCAQLGIPEPYLAFDLDWLVDREFLRLDKGRYYTMFQIETAQDEQKKYGVYLRHRSALSDALVDGLLEKEAEIRRCGFIGCDRPMSELLWLLIYAASAYVPIPLPPVDRPFHKDGGQYFPLGFCRDQPLTEIALDTKGWGYNGAMQHDEYMWFGTYNFATSSVEEMLSNFTAAGKAQNRVLTALIRADFDESTVPESDQVTLAKLVEAGYLRKVNGKLAPAFCVLTAPQYQQLREQVLMPLGKRLAPAMAEMARDMEGYAAAVLPPHLQSSLISMTQRMALADLQYVTTILAFQRGLLKVPKDKQEGAFWTLMYCER